MKQSNYNIIFDYKKKKLASNCLTCALAEIDRNFFEILESIKRKRFCKSTFDEDTQKTLNNMKNDGFIVDDCFDELEFLKFKSYQGKFVAVQVNETSDSAYEHYIYGSGLENYSVYYSSQALQLIIRLFLSYGANVDISDFSGLSVRETVGNGFAELNDSCLSSFIVNFPISSSPEYQRFKEQLKNSVLTEIKIIKYSYFILLLIASLFCIGLYRYS